MRNLADIVKQVAVATEDKTVSIELVCNDAYSAQVLGEDIAEQLRNDLVLSFIVKLRAGQVAS